MPGEIEKVSFFNLTLLFIMSVGLLNHVTIIPALLETAKRDAWLSILAAAFIFSLWVYLVVYISKGTEQQNMYLWVKQHAGKFAAYVLALCLIIFLFFMVVVTLTDLMLWTHIMYLPRTPQLVIVLVFITLCFIAALTNLLTLSILSGLLLPFVIILGYFVFAANLPEKDYTLLFPLFENGLYPALQGILYSGAGLAEVFIIIFMQHRLKKPVRYRYMVLLVLILAYLTLGPTTGAIAVFGPIEAAFKRFPAFELWSIVSIGKYFEHVDFLSIYQWLAGAFIRITLALYILVDVFQIPKGKKRTLTLISFIIFVILVIELQFSDMEFIEFLLHIYLPVSLIFLVTLSLILSLIVFWVKNKKIKSGRG